jgi:hypothetical protein
MVVVRVPQPFFLSIRDFMAKTKLKPTTKKIVVVAQKPAAKPEIVDLRDLPGNNQTVSLKKPQENTIFPPDPRTVFEPVELDSNDLKSTYWQLMSLVRTRFPQLLLRRSESAGPTKTLAFFDETYECTHPPLDGLTPLTWMDPCLFCQVALEDEAVKTLIEEAIKKNSMAAVKKLENRLEELLVEVYLEYVKTQFKTVKTMTARWLIASELWENTAYENYKPKKE